MSLNTETTSTNSNGSACGRRTCFMIVTALAVLPVLPQAHADELSVAEKDGILTVRCGDQLLLEYRSEPNPTKLYISRWFTPQGVQILRDSPHDHVHHHALMYAIGIDGVDFWAEDANSPHGKQIATSTRGESTSLNSGQGRASIHQNILWAGPQNVPLASESRVVTLHWHAIPHASLLTWKFSLAPGKDKASMELWGRHYFGLGMRFVTSTDEDGRFTVAGNAKSVSVRGSEELTRGPWCAFTAQVDGMPVTVAMFDAPDNPRHPATWFTMNSPFAYLTATLNLTDEPLVVTKEKPLMARYGVAAWDGKVDEDTIQAAYTKWVSLD